MPIVDERHEINKVINELEKEGVSLDNIDEMTGLGDVVEGVLIKFGRYRGAIQKMVQPQRV